MQIKGTIKLALPEQSGTSKSGKAWKKREYVVEYEQGQYPKSIVFSVMGDNIEKLNLQQGTEYELSIDFDAREWNGRYFLSASCWRASATGAPQGAPTQTPQPAQSAQPAPTNWESLYPQPTPKESKLAEVAGDPLPF